MSADGPKCASANGLEKERVVFGYVARTSGRRITIHIADGVFSPAKTGLTDGQLIEVDLEDIFGSEFSPFQIELEAHHIQHEIESQLIDQHWEEFDAFCPPEYRDGTQPVSGFSSPEEWDVWINGHQRARRAFVEQLFRSRMIP